MDENKGSEQEDQEKGDDKQVKGIRVTDRRRIHLGGNGDGLTAAASEPPNLKPTYVEELETRTKAAEQRILDVQTRFEQLRTELQQEMDETRRRLNRAADERAQLDKAEFISSLLPAVDNLKRAVEAAEGGSSRESLIDGLRGIASSFESALLAAGAQPIASVGEPFNPDVHEAVDTIEVQPDMVGRVAAEYERGYAIGERLLRPARVRVGRARAEAKNAAE